MKSWKKGKVNWFDDIRGEGVLQDLEGNRYEFHYSTIESKRKWRTLSEDDEVKFKVCGGRKRQVIEKVKRAS
jgi:cold shock CspA family protein